MNSITYGEALRIAMEDGLASNPSAFIIGQGVTDHKGIFGTTSGLREKYGSNRVIESPIAEDVMTGLGLGSSLAGLYPIMTHIRVDFSLLAVNQLINLYAKYKYMFGGQFSPKGLIRMVVGRSWGQGAQHAQSLQSLFSHIPGLTVIMPSSAASVISQYNYAINHFDSLVIAIEHRNLYEIEFNVAELGETPLNSTPWQPRVIRTGQNVTVVATSIMVLEALRAASHLADEFGISCEVIDLQSTTNFDFEVILASVSKTGKLLVADTSWAPYGVASEIVRLICESNPGVLKSPVRSVGMQFTPCPTGKNLEDLFYPSIRTIAEEILTIVEPSKRGQLPSGESYRDYYRKFRGPF
jgi:pyruvate/2-oxoglutarate/acetoin dehydrogenase E1 component